MPRIMEKKVEDQLYVSADGWRMEREHGRTPGGVPLNGRWVLRDHRGTLMGFDQYRHDLAERWELKLGELTCTH